MENAIDSLNEDIVNNKNEEIKQILEKIKTRETTRNFLRNLNFYLINKDFKRIRKVYYSKGDIIITRTKKAFLEILKNCA